jgi:magnesium chelatase subunit D
MTGDEDSTLCSRQDAGRVRWNDALVAARLFSVDPVGLCGISVRAGPGPVRDVWSNYLKQILASDAPIRRMPASIEDDRLLGCVDLAATLKLGRPIVQNGILAEAHGGCLMIVMAERLSMQVGARIASALDRREIAIEREGISRVVPTAFGVVALDEGASPEEQIPESLAHRFAFHIDLSDLSLRDATIGDVEIAKIAEARVRLNQVAEPSDEIIGAMAATSASLGIESILPPMLALKVARAAAAFAGRLSITDDDAMLAAQLVLASRARSVAAAPEDDREGGSDDPEEGDARPDAATPPHDGDREHEKPLAKVPLEDVMRAAVRSALPEGLLAAMKGGSIDRKPPSRRSGVGASQASLSRGRPAGVRMAALRPGTRLALVETLRAAAPWQQIRRAERKSPAGSGRIDVRPQDFRIRKFIQRRESSIIFCVDASGSTAFHRLAEAKGAVELLLGEAYVARTYASLVAFRGNGAELLLPPSRSLTRAKSMLAHLPGGGGTPLASGIDAALAVAISERIKGREPQIVILTDGRANIARDGRPSRPEAWNDAMSAALQLGSQHISAIFVDTSVRAREEGRTLSQTMKAHYVALPYADATTVRDVVRAATP